MAILKEIFSFGKQKYFVKDVHRPIDGPNKHDKDIIVIVL